MAQTDVVLSRSALRDEIRKDLLTRANDFYRDLEELVTIAPADVATGDEGNGHSDLEAPRRAKLEVLTRKAFTDVVNEIFEIPLPPPSEHNAEVATPAKVIVAAKCPKCGIAQPIVVDITPELLVDDDGSELRIKSKAKGRTHVCGQLPLPDAPPVDQLTLDYGTAVVEIVPDAPRPGDIVEDDSELEDCHANALHDGRIIACYRPLDHDGDHYDDERETTWRLAPAVDVDEVVATGEAIAETLPDVGEVLAGAVDDDALLPGGPALECVGSNHVPGCEHITDRAGGEK